MRSRLLSLFAVLGLLVHVAAWAHHAAMTDSAMSPETAAASPIEATGAPILEARFASALLVICHASSANDPWKSHDGSKAPYGKLKPCPLCSLSQVAQTLPPAGLETLTAPVGIQLETSFAHADQRREYQRKIRPPGRAPPASLA